MGGVDLEVVIVVGITLIDVLGNNDMMVGRDVEVVEQVGVEGREPNAGSDRAVPVVFELMVEVVLGKNPVVKVPFIIHPFSVVCSKHK